MYFPGCLRFGDYSMIKSFIIAYDLDDQIKTNKSTLGYRKFTTDMKPVLFVE